MTTRALCVAITLLFASRLASAQDAFEIQVYDSGVDAAGHAGLELHLNDVLIGLKTSTPPEIPSNGLFHTTLEPSIGIGHNWELGGYLQAAGGPDTPYQFAGAKLRAKVRIPFTDQWSIAINGELSYVPAKFESNIWGGEIRPIVQFETSRWLVDFNPILTFDWTGPYTAIPHFEPCIAVRVKFAGRWMVGPEYYMALGPLSAVLPWPQEYQAVFLTGDVALPLGFGIHLGVGTGLTPATNPLVIKSILSKDF